MADAQLIENALLQICDQKSFIQKLLIEVLDWPIEEQTEDLEDITFEWSAAELRAEGLDKSIVNGTIRQIRPFESNPWGIFILEFNRPDVFTSGRGMTSVLRKVLRGLVPSKRRGAHLAAFSRDNLLFICNHNYEHYRFAHFKDPKEEGRIAPLATFGWGPGDSIRTLCEFNIKSLAWPDTELDEQGWLSTWQSAFDVEKVTRKFYEDYRGVFETIEELIAKENTIDDEDLRMFTQTLFNRLLFLRFIERKGWLKFGDDTNYLRNLYKAGPIGNESFYKSRLYPLFFEGLAIDGKQSSDIYGTVPYLNSGLFEKKSLDQIIADLPDSVFIPILSKDGLFYKYNFTVEESTPLDIEVAVDPEMLGKVFEKLVIGRRETGSYYTPRPVVSFMCREALKGYLGSQYSPLIDEQITDNISISEAKNLVSKLNEIRVVDPACGSGAYLLGMLQELYSIINLLDTRFKELDCHDTYKRKLDIIQNNIYGVDIDDFAVNIARLRLWISLAVEFEGDEPDPLPNLDFKIECSDSLTAPDPSGGRQLDLIRQQQIGKFEELKAKFMDPRIRTEHPEIEEEIIELRKQIAEFAHPNESAEGFDWRVEFAEVWAEKNGFDIVLANPPYGAKVDNSIRNQYFNQQYKSE
jgi:hypothetical protein